MELLYGLELRPRLHVLPRMAAIENVVSIIVAVLVWPMFISLSLWAAWGG